MTLKIKVGDRVKLLGMPSWLIHDLPENEQAEMIKFIGQSTTVQKIDDYGYYWIGFGVTIEGNDTYYSGHSFAVPEEFLVKEID